MKQRSYIAIDLKSFYASVECRERGLDPLDTNLVVADESRTDKTICLAVTPSLKSYGISGRARLFEVVQQVREANKGRLYDAPGHCFTGRSCFLSELKADPSLKIDYLIAPPRMAYYMEYSTRIYEIYLKYVAPEDIIVYSIDEVFMDVTNYLDTYRLSPRDLAMKMILDVLDATGITATAGIGIVYSIDEVFMDVTNYLDTYRLSPRDLAMKMILDVLDATGITATAGIGTNLFLCKVAMDIVAKHIPADKNGVRIAELDEMSFRRQLWTHQPITDFWRVGRGYAKKLEEHGMFTMGDVAKCSHENEDLLYRLFGKNAELLIDHAWGWEPCTVEAVKAYRPSENSLGSGQVLHCPYTADKARLVLREMAESLALDLVSKRLVTDQVVVTVGYDIENLTDPERASHYNGLVVSDHYGRRIPKHAHGTERLETHTSSTKKIMGAATALFDRLVDPNLLIRRLNIVAGHVMPENDAKKRNSGFEQLDLFGDYTAQKAKQEQEEAELVRERKMQETMLAIKRKYGKNAILFEQLDLFGDYTAQKAKQEQEEAELVRERKMQETMLAIKRKYGKNAILKGMNLEEGATAKDRNDQIGGHRA